MSNRLMKALRLTDEENAETFERFANAFLVDDYPELEPVGGKKDQGMDARVVTDGNDAPVLVVQSCVSPAGAAKRKIRKTIEKLQGKMPKEFVYCTPAVVGTSLDALKRELRIQHRVTLQVCDGAWFVQRCETSHNRAALSDSYAKDVLEPIVRELTPDRLYSHVLSDNEARVAIQYLEALNLDRSRDSDLTKGIFQALITCVMRHSDQQAKVYTEGQIASAICSMFPAGHASRIREIVHGRLVSLAQKNPPAIQAQAGGYVLSPAYRGKVQDNIAKARDRELAFMSALSANVNATATERGVDYEFPTEAVVGVGHQCVLWYMREQGKTVSDPTSDLLGILNAERLIETYMKKHPLPKAKGAGKLTRDVVMDLLPHALYVTLRSKDPEIAGYLRSKADLFIMHAFLQLTPDVRDACRKLLGGDILYLDTTVLIRCIAEYYSPEEQRALLHTLEGARKMGYRLRTWRPYIAELVSHLKGPILLEWANHYKHLPKEQIDGLLRTAPTLIAVFHKRAAGGVSLERTVEEVIGKTNEHQNAAEFLRHTFGIDTEELPRFDGDDESLRGRAWAAWLEHKKKHEGMAEEKFQILVRNDVSAYVALVRLRRHHRPEGSANYGYKTWYLTFDRMPWRVAKVLCPERDSLYEVAMSYSFLINSVATLVNVGSVHLPDEVLPATTVLDENEMVPSELRAAYQAAYNPDEPPFLRERRLRDLAHQLKSSEPLSDEPTGAELPIEILPNEDI